MIISSAFSQWGSVDHSRARVIGDLRSVMAKFMGRTPPKYDDTYALLGDLRRTSGTGVWKSFDGGALRIRVYLIGTVHLEIHPDMSWRLNQVLAYLYPAAIPSELRQAPSRKPKNVPLMERPLPFAVLEVIRSMTGDRVKKGVRIFGYGQDKTTVAFSEAKRVLASLGAAVDNVGAQFDYDPSDTIGELIRHGCVPDQISHQFYPTPPLIAADAVALAEIGPDDHVLEPSAGNGDIAALLPSERTTCVEIADLRCSVLKARGLTVKQADFLKWKPEQNEAPITRIVMNPPFADGRAAAHVEHAYSLLQPGGRLVAVLPASFKGKQPVGGDIKWSTIYSNEFHGTSVSVVLMTANKPQ